MFPTRTQQVPPENCIDKHKKKKKKNKMRSKPEISEEMNPKAYGIIFMFFVICAFIKPNEGLKNMQSQKVLAEQLL